MMNKKHISITHQGFTIVELLIVIVVIAILASISIVTYTGIQTRARNTATIAGVRTHIGHLEVYAAENGDYPRAIGTEGNYYCLGSGYPNQTCAAAPYGSFGSPLEIRESTAFNSAIYGTTTPPPVSTYKLEHQSYYVIGAYYMVDYSSYTRGVVKYWLRGDTSCGIPGAQKRVRI